MKKSFAFFILILSILLYGGEKMKFYSKSFSNGEYIPQKFTCKGEDISPQLIWEDPPSQVKSFVIIVDDPDAPLGTWVHWVIYNIPAYIRSLPEGVAQIPKLENGAVQGKNDFNNYGYGGPCPPPGKPHRYFFKLYAIDTTLNLSPGATKDQVIEAMKNHVIEKTEFFGLFKR